MPAGRRMGVTEQQRTAAFRQLADQRLDASYRLATAILGDASQSQDAVPSLDRARGTTFIGVYEGATPKEGGSTTSHLDRRARLCRSAAPGTARRLGHRLRLSCHRVP
jgi:hypothetical protein